MRRVTFESFRQATGLNQAEFADRLGIKKSHVSRCEGRALTRMLLATLADYADLVAGAELVLVAVTPERQVVVLDDPDPLAAEKE